ncbi:LysR substrate-binding domain-containing protein [Achromobacter sp. Marseille-Q0513]|uniref:LysR family transcriptional regulator n=1 Tax=Achromobacter sp. Marseille-Q0513 TaxID=2829161 RepID=UPI0020111EF4|nr:LysR substrate-binding domain-containing protein [Achromobacter sp. Marseille-Q0513]
MKRLQDMELFAEVAARGSFSLAAAALGMPRSTLSRRLAGLERSVGLSLLSRSTRKLALTEAGQLYLRRCRRILAEARLVHEELQDDNAPFEGLLRVNLPAGFATEALAGAFVDFTRRHPGVRLQLNLANPEHAGRVFDAADLTLCVGEPPVSARVAHHLGFVSGGLYAAEAYLAAWGEPAHPSALREEDCIGFRLRADGAATRWPLVCGDERVQVQPASRFSVNEAGMARRLAALGAGVAALGGDQERYVRAGLLRRILPQWRVAPFPVYALTETRLLPARVRALAGHLARRLG